MNRTKADEFVPEILLKYKLKKQGRATEEATFIRMVDGSAMVTVGGGSGRVYEGSKDSWKSGWEWLIEKGYILSENQDVSAELRALLDKANRERDES